MSIFTVRNCVAALAMAAGIFAIWIAQGVFRVGAGYKAKIACSEIFVAHRDPAQIIDNEFRDINPILGLVRVRIDRDTMTARAAGPLGLGSARAIYRPGYGCTLMNGGTPKPLAALPSRPIPTTLQAAPASAKQEKIQSILDAAFTDDTAGHRAFLVVKDGAVLAEAYAEGFSATTPMLSWSVAKSVTASLVGVAVQQGIINVSAPVPVPEWRDDPARSRITWTDLLQMQSGLSFEENYGKPRSDVNVMLQTARDAGAIAAAQPLAHRPGEHWNYSSGTSNLLARTMHQVLAAAGEDDQVFARQMLFDRIGAHSFILEPDGSGVFIGSSYVYATTHDWARLALLYLQNGQWDGETILPPNWPAFVSTPAAASENQYGAHFWLNRPSEDGFMRLPDSKLPHDVYYMSGHEGQFVIIFPSENMIIARFGMTRGQSPLTVVAPMLHEIYQIVASQ